MYINSDHGHNITGDINIKYLKVQNLMKYDVKFQPPLVQTLTLEKTSANYGY